jgi:FMN phosphatase YigB (HAD superfamily)
MGYNQDMNLILFDIDNTLLDTPRYARRALEKMQSVLGIDDSVLLEKREAYYQSLHEPTDFSPESFVDFLHIKNEALRREALGCWYDSELLKQCVFVDFTRNSEGFGHHAILGIFSQGIAEFQIKKMQLMGIYDYFEQKYMFIKNRKASPESLRELQELIAPSEHNSFQQVVVVDDKVEYLKALREIPQISPVLIQRQHTNTVAAPSEMLGIKVVSSLADL